SNGVLVRTAVLSHFTGKSERLHSGIAVLLRRNIYIALPLPLAIVEASVLVTVKAMQFPSPFSIRRSFNYLDALLGITMVLNGDLPLHAVRITGWIHDRLLDGEFWLAIDRFQAQRRFVR